MILVYLLPLTVRCVAGAAAGATAESEPPAPPTKSTADEMSEMAKEQLAKIAKEMGMPVWALYCIGIGKSVSDVFAVVCLFFSPKVGSNLARMLFDVLAGVGRSMFVLFCFVFCLFLLFHRWFFICFY